MADLPILWHIPVSHYSEKVRWALDLKGVEHERKQTMAGAHMALALARTKGQVYTFPVMKLNGRSVGDSTAIIEALEAAYPDPPLYPSDPGERRRALELEDWFDENLGPASRVVAWHEIARDQASLESVAANSVPPAFGRSSKLSGAVAKGFVAMRFRVLSDERAARARQEVLTAFDKLEDELGGRDYLVGDSFTVADLTAASLFYPLALPPEAPRVIERAPTGMDEFTAPLRERPGYRWIGEMFRRHRNNGGARRA